MTACLTADVDALLDVLAPDVVIVSDGGGVAKAPRRPVFGRDHVARLLAGILLKLPDGAVGTLETFNGAMGIVVRVGTEPVSSMAIRVADGQIESLQLQANPDKLWPLRTRTGVPIV
jgi:RNA polymerase sigma-70 factor (ECF subfamily)